MWGQNLKLLPIVATAMLLIGCASEGPKPEDILPTPKHFLIGHDVAGARTYVNSGCCIAPQGLSVNVSLYQLLSPNLGFGGIGLNADGEPVTNTPNLGSGPVNAYKAYFDFDASHLSLGVSFAEVRSQGAIKRIPAGGYDYQIDQLAQFLSRIPGTVYLRPGYEFDAAWHRGYNNPADHVAAYRYIIDRLRSRDIGDVQFVWQAATSIVDDGLEQRRENVMDWYPGDDYVDWIGITWHTGIDQRPTSTSEVQLTSLHEQALTLVEMAREKRIPVMIAEATPAGFNLSSGDRAYHSIVVDGVPGKGREPVTSRSIWEYWYLPMFDFMDRHVDVIRGLTYHNAYWDKQPRWGPPYERGYWGDSRLENNSLLGTYFSMRMRLWLSSP